MEPCATYQNLHHQLTVVIDLQQGETCWPFSFKVMHEQHEMKFNQLNKVNVAIMHGTEYCDIVIGRVHRAPTSVAGEFMKEGQLLRMSNVFALKDMLTMWHGKCLSQPNSIPLYHLLMPTNTNVSFVSK